MSLRRPPALPVGLVGLARPRSTGTAARVWWIVAIVAIVANLVTTAFIGATATRPAFPFDELHLLELSRLLAGFDVPTFDSGGYYPGWAVLLTPLWWIWNDPEAVYRAAAVFGWLLAAGTIYPLALLVRRLRLSLPQALTVAAIVSTLPARSVQADYVLSERMLFLLVVCSALAAFRLWERTTWPRAVVFSVLAAAVYFTHMRMLPLVLASAVWLVALLLKRWHVALIGLVALGAGYFAADRLGTRLNTVLLGREPSQSDSVWANIEQMRLGVFLRVALGQTWNQIVGSYGLFAIGAIALILLTWREIRRFRMGRATWVFGVVSATWLLSVVAWASDWNLYLNPWQRLDAWIYGRYLDPVAALVVALGLAVIVRGVRTSVWSAALVAALGVMVPTVFWVSREAPTWGYVTPAHIAGVLPWAWTLPTEPIPRGLTPTFTNENSFWLIASVCALACLIGYRLVRRIEWAAPVALVVLSVLGSLGANASSDRFREIETYHPEMFSALQELVDEHPDLDVAWDRACDRSGFMTGVGQNMLGYALLPDVSMEAIRTDEDASPDADIVLSCIGDSPLTETGALPLRDAVIYESWLWIMPGELQDELVAEGELQD